MLCGPLLLNMPACEFQLEVHPSHGHIRLRVFFTKTTFGWNKPSLKIGIFLYIQSVVGVPVGIYLGTKIRT